MGTLSKRPLREFGVDLKRMEDFRTRGRTDAGAPAEPSRWLRASTCFALAGMSFVGSLALKALGRNHLSLLVGQWVPTFVVLALYVDSSAPEGV